MSVPGNEVGLAAGWEGAFVLSPRVKAKVGSEGCDGSRERREEGRGSRGIILCCSTRGKEIQVIKWWLEG